jgi:hypothetical protein
MDSDHALCRGCRNVVRTDWERCFHCGLHHPVTRPVGISLLHSGLSLLALAAVAVLAMNGPEVWRTVRTAPELLAREAPAAARAAKPLHAPTVPTFQVASSGSAGGAPAFGVAQPGIATRIAPAPVTTTTTTTSTSAGDVARTPQGAPAASGLPSARRLDHDQTTRQIEECATTADLDALEKRLREEYPEDPALGIGGRTWRQLKTRRAALAVR